MDSRQPQHFQSTSNRKSLINDLGIEDAVFSREIEDHRV